MKTPASFYESNEEEREQYLALSWSNGDLSRVCLSEELELSTGKLQTEFGSL